MDALREVGPGGHFLGAEHTLRNYRDGFLQAVDIVDRKLRPVEPNGRDDGGRRGRRTLEDCPGRVPGPWNRSGHRRTAA